MHHPRHRSPLAWLWLCVLLSACTLLVIPPQNEDNPPSLTEAAPVPVPSFTPEAEGLLTICLPNEPASLFVYADTSRSAEIVRQALFDPPVEMIDFQPQAVLLEQLPAQEDGSIRFEPVEVQKGNLIVNSEGFLVNLSEGVRVLPFGCKSLDCALSYTESMGKIHMSQMIVKFTLRNDLLWSDGAPLVADDSVFSFEIANAYYPMIPKPESIAYTQSYQSLDTKTVEWRGVPGYSPAYPVDFFFQPVPRHVGMNFSPEDLRTAEQFNQQPIGWGAFALEEWTPGDHISLKRNPNYFQASANLPYFDRLTFRFISNQSQAIEALRIGECDVLDASYDLESQRTQLEALQVEGKVKLVQRSSRGLVALTFGISSEALGFFEPKEARQAVAMCLDKAQIMENVFQDRAELAESYLPTGHPLLAMEFKRYTYDVPAASDLLTRLGWLDHDGNPLTPRLAQGVAGVADGTEFAVELLALDEPGQLTLAEAIAEAMAQCGLRLTVRALPAETLYAASENAPLFGRRFDLALISYASGELPACAWFTSSQIPGPITEAPLGWAGLNIAGYSRNEFDAACQSATMVPYLSAEWHQAQREAHAIFQEDLPVLPLYWLKQTWALRAGLCVPQSHSIASDIYWNLEAWTDAETCE